MTILEKIKENAAKFSEKIAVVEHGIDYENKMTWKEL